MSDMEACTSVAAAHAVTKVVVKDGDAGQRLDNFLVTRLKGVPKTRVYRIIRRGEVRINGSRSKPATRLHSGDIVRIPPIRTSQRSELDRIPDNLANLEDLVIYEDRHLLVLNKPAGIAVHGGSGIRVGIIEALKRSPLAGDYLELAHRLDRETSGCLVLARSRASLEVLHRAFRRDDAGVIKRYSALLSGRWAGSGVRVDAPLKRFRESTTGQSRVCVAEDGRQALSIVDSERMFADATLVRVTLETGRMHQARIHCRHIGHPILGDTVYGDFSANRAFRSLGLTRMFLHAAELGLRHPVSGKPMTFRAPLSADLLLVLERLERAESLGHGRGHVEYNEHLRDR